MLTEWCEEPLSNEISLELVKYLIDNGAVINTRNADHFSSPLELIRENFFDNNPVYSKTEIYKYIAKISGEFVEDLGEVTELDVRLHNAEVEANLMRFDEHGNILDE